MDWLLLIILICGFLRGYFKGAVSTIFSFVGIIFSMYFSLHFLDMVFPIIDNACGECLFEAVSNVFEKIDLGTFGSIEEFKYAIKNSWLNVFGIFEKVLGNVTFEGDLTVGQILSPILTDALLKILSFVCLFLICIIVVNLIKKILNKIIKMCDLSVFNKLIGGVVGAFKGGVVFLIIFCILINLSNIFLSQKLLDFVNSGIISNYLYKIVSNFSF